MRQRSIFAIGLFSSLAAASALVACEDGPDQTFTTAPANAATLWNNGNPDASVSSGTAPYDAGFGSVSALQNCTSDQKRLIWANMLQQPVALPLHFAGINLAGKTQIEQDAFKGITLQEAESINCVGNPNGPGSITWGDNGEVQFDYTTSTYTVSDIGLNLGYTGKMTMHQRPSSRFGSHEYVFQLGQPILRDNAIFEINWSDISHHDLNEIFNAIMATFGAGLVAQNTIDPDPNDCYGDGSCLIVTPAQAPANGGYCFMAFLPIEGFLFQTDCTTNVQPTISIPTNMFQEYYLSEPYSYMSNVQLLSAQGPVSLPRFNNTSDPPNCYLQLGMDWKTYVANCIDIAPPGSNLNTVVDDAGLNIKQVNEAKMYAAHTHDNETIDFNVVGVNLLWADETVEADPTAIVQDPDLPNVTDAIQAREVQWGTDIYDNGLPINDLDNGGSFTGTGSAYIYREWARLMQNDVNAILAKAHPCTGGATTGCGAFKYNHVIGDPACFTDPVTAQGLGCTGLEGLAFQGVPDLADSCGSGTPAPICANYAAGAYFKLTFGGGGYGASALHSGNLYSIFCQNPAAVNGGSADGGTLDPLNGNCTYNTIWIGALANVTAVAGLGNVNTLPPELADRRYYFRWYGIAEVKYLKAYGNNAQSQAADVAAQQIDMESVFYDTNGPFDFLEYIERSYMTNTTTTYVANQPGSVGAPGAVTVPGNVNSAPMDFSMGVETLSGEYQFTSWYKFMYRQEAAMFKAMLVNKADLPGSENNVNITNLAGNALLQANYASYECATQWPNVTIAALGINDEPWANVCSQGCPNLQGVYPSCPLPPLAAPTATSVSCASPSAVCPAGTGCNPYTQFCQSLELDLNGANPTIGLGGNTGRLAAYPAVWGQGAACNDSKNTCSVETATTKVCGVSKLPCNQDADCIPTLDPHAASNNPYSTSPCAGFANGLPIASGTGSVFAVGHKATAANRLKYASTNPNQMTAYVSIPNAPNPYNAIQAQGAPVPAPILVTLPWTPSYDGVGFDIPVDATRTKFIQTEQIEFTGILEGYRLDVIPWTNPLTNQPDGTLTVDAIEGDDFLGEAFLCQDLGSYPVPGTGDLLGAHMYDSAGTILTWITNHPGSEIGCQIIVRYTIFNNYVDYITSLSSGVLLSFSTGTALGRLDGVIAFDPTLVGAP